MQVTITHKMDLFSRVTTSCDFHMG